MTHAVRSLKRAVLREEFVALTGDAFQALVLNQFIYWVQKVNDFDDFLREEQERNPDCNVSLRHGWIYKKAQELIEETMLQMSDITMRRIIKVLIEKGWIEERTNPDNRWNKVLQYRPDLKKIQQDLYGLGYALPGFPLLQPAQRSEAPKLQIEGSNLQNEASNLQTDRFILKDTETTSEITAKNSADMRTDVSKLMLETWNRLLCPPVPVFLTPERSERLQAVLSEHFENKAGLWEQFCREITQSSFLMGKGQRGWRVTLDWILDSRNLHKTLEGNYRDHEASPALTAPEKLSSEELKLKVTQHLESFSDPLSRLFCRALLRHLPEQKFLFWFKDAALCGWENSRLVLSFPSRAARNYVERHFSSEMGSAARRVCPDLKSLSLTVQQEVPQSSCQESSAIQTRPEMDSSPMQNSPDVSKTEMLPLREDRSWDEGDPSPTFPTCLTQEDQTPRYHPVDTRTQAQSPQTTETGEQTETPLLESSSFPMTNSPAPSKAQTLEPRYDLLPRGYDACERCPPALQTREQAAETPMMDQSSCGNSPSSQDIPTDERESVFFQNNIDLPSTPAEDRVAAIFNPCFFPEEKPATQTASSRSSQPFRPQNHDPLSALQGYFPDRNEGDASLIGGSEGHDHQHQPPTFLQSPEEENPWKQAVKGLLTSCLPSSSHTFMERNLS
jgi:DNA-binding MarR family transcriptional regulator